MTVAEDAGAARRDGAPLAPVPNQNRATSHQTPPPLPRADSAYAPPAQVSGPHRQHGSGRRPPRTSSTAIPPHAVLLDVDALDPAPGAATLDSPSRRIPPREFLARRGAFPPTPPSPRTTVASSYPVSSTWRPWRRRARRAWTWARASIRFWRSGYDIALTGIAFAIFALCSFIACLANAYADRINPNNLVPMDERRALLDPGMNWAYDVFRSIHVLPRDLPDWMTRLASALIISRAVTLGRRGCTVFRRALYIAGAAYLLRAPTVLMTVLPNPLLECESRPHPNLVLDALMLFAQARSSCGDVFFSGHSIFFAVQARLWLQYSRNPVLRMLAVAVAIFSLASLIFSRYHYSIDVFMATLIVSTLYSLYHWTVQGKIGSRSWWGRLIIALDGEIELDRRAGRRHGRRSTRRSGPRRAARRSVMTGATPPPGMSATSGSSWWLSARARTTPSPLPNSRPCSGRGPVSEAASVAAAWLASKKWDDPTAFAAAEASEGDVDVDEDDVELGYVRPSHRAAAVAARDSDASDVEDDGGVPSAASWRTFPTTGAVRAAVGDVAQ